MGIFLLSGTLSTVPATTTPIAIMSPSHTVTLTAYNAVPEQTDDDPFVTASGAYSNPDIVAARSRDLAEMLPFGTIIEIIGPTTSNNSCGYDVVAPIIGYRVIADTMNARYTDRIDILFHTDSNYSRKDGSTKNASKILGICTGASIRVVGYVDIRRQSNTPKTQRELAALVNNSNNSIALK